MNSDRKHQVEYSPAVDLARNRDHPYKKPPTRRATTKQQMDDDDKFLSPIAPAPSSSNVVDSPAIDSKTLELPKIETHRFKPIKSLAWRINGSEFCDEATTEKIIEMLEIGQIDEAVAYADKLYANFLNNENDQLDIVALADYLKILTVLRQWRRINHLVAKKNYHQIHIVFAYHAIIAMFHRKMYEEVIELPVGHLIPNSINHHLPLRSPSHVTGRDVEEERMKYSFANMAELDNIARKLRIAPALMLAVAESYLKLTNRDAAMLCIAYAVDNDNTPVYVERLMTKYNLVEPSEWERYKNLRKPQLEAENRPNDPRTLMEMAQNAYEMGKFAEAKKCTDQIFDNFGPHSECMILHIHCMTMLRDSRGLLELGHQLVADDPHVPLPWYCVALYYYTIGANSRARSFISKCTMMDSCFAEAWVAFGHILNYEVEHEQSMSCYYRASKLVDRSCEPFLYVALQYSSHSQKLSKKFMMEAVSRSPKDPLIRHEEACIAFVSKNYAEADRIFKQVLYMVTDCTEETPLEEMLKKKLEDFWRPMINNLGHIARKMGRIEEAILFHERAIKMEPKYVDAIASIAMCYAVMGKISRATQYFNRALAVDPFNETIRQCMSKMILAEKSIYDIDENIDISVLDIGTYEKQKIIENSAIRTPFNDAYVIPKVPKCQRPMMTIGRSAKNSNDVEMEEE